MDLKAQRRSQKRHEAYPYVRPGQFRIVDWMKPASVYVIASADRVKIGIAADPAIRMGHLQLACPFKLELAAEIEFSTRSAAREVEKALHSEFKAGWLWGEWFVADPAAVVTSLRAREQALSIT